jgi:hypothetical protein
MDTLMKYKNTHLNHDICSNQTDHLKPIKFYQPIHMVSHPTEEPPRMKVFCDVKLRHGQALLNILKALLAQQHRITHI